MFSPVSQISNPSFPFFSLSPPFISSFTLFRLFVIFSAIVLVQLNLGLSMDSTAFVFSLLFPFFPPSPHLQSLPSFLLPPSTLFLTLSPPFHLMCFMVYPLSTLFISSILLIPFSHLTHFFIITAFPFFHLPSSLVSLPSLSSISFPFHYHPLFLHLFHILSQQQPSDNTSFWYLL